MKTISSTKYTTEAQQLTAVWYNGGYSASYDSFVVGSSAVLRLNFCAKNPPLRQAAKRYVQVKKQHMKKFFSLLLLVAITSGTKGQEVSFRSRFLPEKEYLTTSSTDSKNIMNISGPEERILKIKENGFEFPIESITQTQIQTEMKNGEKQEDESFLYTILYKSINTTTIQNGNKEERENPMTGLIVEGKYNRDGQVEVLNIISDKVNDATKNIIKSSLETVTQNIPFPEDPMKIGDSFNQVIPMTIPVADLASVNIIISTTYTLDEVKDTIAYFNLNQKIELNMDQETAAIKAEGKGIGKAIYDTKYNFLKDYGTDLKMKISVGVEDLIITNELVTKTSQRVEIK
ncbi:hypothetical protein D0X99_07150 [Algoriphagus lacus]|uniref:Uncharacterized protein n=1 Tax=Algoriphagus lacus TaxID=2056311 RepID=A0A418PV85_9BACT|nr:hypothetical protein [Algoriphagus lacus]RIW17492.1 hypothetical protein D0X99_07150 [Algoriphagus lacus]